MKQLTCVGKILGLWTPNVSSSLSNVLRLRTNVTLEGHDATFGGTLRFKLILFCQILLFVINWPGRPNSFEFKLILGLIWYK
jgi:hypothetical protein